jgi:hypothetical protein
MTASTPRRHGFIASWLLWTAGFLAFPIAGVAAARSRVAWTAPPLP